MRKIFRISLITVFLLSILNFALSANGKNDRNQDLQRRNEGIINRVLMLKRAYRHVSNDEAKANISNKIFAEVETWSVNNKQLIFKSKGAEKLSIEEKKELVKTTNQELLSEIKSGQIPEIMLKSLPSQTAERMKQRSAMDGAVNSVNTTGPKTQTSKEIKKKESKSLFSRIFGK